MSLYLLYDVINFIR